MKAGTGLVGYSRRGWRGRTQEWRTVADLLWAAERSRGGVLLVEGRSGMGKSRLLDEAADAAAERGFTVARGKAIELNQLAPLAPLTAALGESVQSLRAGRPDAVDLRLWLMEQLQDRLEQRAARGPLLIMLDDLQWADPTALLALRSLIPGLFSYPLVWILARTSGDDDGDVVLLFDILERDGAGRIVLAALDEQTVIEVITDVFGMPPEPDLLALAAGSAGNPFLLTEMLGALRDEGVVGVIDGHARLLSREVPQRFQEFACGRLSNVSPRTRRLLQVAAILGCSFSVDDLAAMFGEPAGSLRPALEEAEAAGAVVPSGDLLVFRHDLIRQSIIETLNTPIREALHRQAGQMLLQRGGSALPAANHLMHYARPGDARALNGLDQAVKEVLPSSPPTAAALAVRALELTDHSDPGRSDRAVTAVNALAAAGRPSEAADLAHAALPHVTLPDHAARLRYELAYVLMLAGYPADAVVEAEQAVAEPGLSREGRDCAEGVLFRALYASQDDTRGRERARTVIADSQRHSSPALIGAHVLLMHDNLARGRASDALDHIREAVRLATGPPQAQNAHPRLFQADLLIDVGRFDEAESNLRASTEDIAALGHTCYVAGPPLFRARLRLAEGRYDDAAAEAQAGLAVADAFDMPAFALVGISVLAIEAIRRGDLEAAADFAKRYESLHRSGKGVTFGAARGNLAMALVTEARDGPKNALHMLRTAYTNATQRTWLLTVEPDAAPWLTRLATHTGDTVSAEAIVATAQRIARDNPGFPTLTASATHAHGILHADPASLTHALATHVGPWSRASAAEDLGVVLSGSSDIPDPDHTAIHSLDRALKDYQQVGATRDAARVRARLRKLGVRRHHWSQTERPVSGWGSLTDTECNVATLVAQGLTNPQVASRLYISAHTVKFHLRQVFQKLGIASRVELARLAAESPGNTPSST